VLDDLLLKLEPRNQAIVRDSAMHFFYAPNIAARDKAYAAYVIGIARSQPPENDRATGCAWIRNAMNLDPSQAKYRDVFAQYCQR